MQWSGSFVGSDFKLFLQIAPLILHNFLPFVNPGPGPTAETRANILTLFISLAEMHRLIYQSSIDDLGSWQYECQRLVSQIIYCFSNWETTPAAADSTLGEISEEAAGSGNHRQAQKCRGRGSTGRSSGACSQISLRASGS